MQMVKCSTPFYRSLPMTKRTVTFLLFLLALSSTKGYAGWYECYNFKGSIENYPITLSIQFIEGFFGEKDKKSFNIIGVYKYDKHNHLIRLEGKINFKTNEAILYEIHNNKHYAIFAFNFSKTECKGTWENLSTNKKLPLSLNYISQLIDTEQENKLTTSEILQVESLNNLYFIGDYSVSDKGFKAQMNRLKIIQKRDNIVFQTIDFSKIETQTGSVMTIIFDNVHVIDAKTKKLTVTNDVGRVGGYLTIFFNSKTQRFELDTNPIAEGPN